MATALLLCGHTAYSGRRAFCTDCETRFCPTCLLCRRGRPSNFAIGPFCITFEYPLKFPTKYACTSRNASAPSLALSRPEPVRLSNLEKSSRKLANLISLQFPLLPRQLTRCHGLTRGCRAKLKRKRVTNQKPRAVYQKATGARRDGLAWPKLSLRLRAPAAPFHAIFNNTNIIYNKIFSSGAENQSSMEMTMAPSPSLLSLPSDVLRSLRLPACNL